MTIGLINWYINRPWWENVIRNIVCPIFFNWHDHQIEINGLSVLLYVILYLTFR